MYTILEDSLYNYSNLAISASLNCASFGKWCPQNDYCAHGFTVCVFNNGCGYNNESGNSRCCKC